MRILGPLLAVAYPAVCEALVFHAGYVVFSILVSWLGTVALAAHRVCISVESLAFMPCTGLAVAAATHTGQRLGAGRPDLAAEGIARVRRRAIAYMVVVGLILFVFAGPIVRVYTDDPEVAVVAVPALHVGATELVPLGISMAMTGALQGAGDTTSPLWITLVGIWLVRLPSTLLVVFMGWGLVAVWVVTALDWVVRSYLADRAIRSGRWRGVLNSGGSACQEP